MTNPNNRRNFLRGRFSPRKGPLRPPWARDEADFLAACTRCGDCLGACPTRIINDRDSGYPAIDFAVGECTFCGDCVTACKTGALMRNRLDAAWIVQVTIGEQCLARQRTECRICGEQCEAAAIRFPPLAGSIATPEIDRDRCTGCGACVAPCPTQAIDVSRSCS